MTQSNQDHTLPNSQDADNNQPEPAAAPDEVTPNKLVIVGLGASAGGLAALETFFTHTPADTGMAFVVVMHLMRHHKSNLSDLLQHYTPMPVVQIKNNTLVEPNHVYVIPPNHELGILNGRLQLLKLTQKEPAMAIDSFFRHLANDQGPQAICVILSGTGTDGTLGLKAVAEQGGLVVTQTSDSAEYRGMPDSAINTGQVDLILDPAEMPQALVDFVRQVDFRTKETELDETWREELNKIFLLLRAETGLNFGRYRPSTLHRRVAKRMAVHQLDNVADYTDYVRQHRDELMDLYQEILIGVTQFFREMEAFEVIKSKVLPALFERRPVDRPLRVWVPGCSTGEEAYSLALLIHDYQQEVLPGLRIEIFATDINTAMIDQARAGEYPGAIAADVPEHYLKRYFVKKDHTYQIKSEIREMVIFAEQNLLNDPPFSKLELISCRNVLIYLKTETQQQVMSLFQYGLKPGGFLFLGSSESIGEQSDYFTVIDRKWRVFKRTDVRATPPPDVTFFSFTDFNNVPSRTVQTGGLPEQAQGNQRLLLEQSLLEHYQPVGIMVDEGYNIRYTYGQIDQFLKLVAGAARLNILDMLRPGLDVPLPPAIRYALTNRESTIHPHVWVKTNGEEMYVDVTVKPIGADPNSRLALLIIEGEAPSEPQEGEAAVQLTADGGNEQIETFRKELTLTKKQLQKTIEQLQAANEEHRSYAEELQSGNEELQSTNEELTTSQEELRSVNEELVTANSEIQKKNQQLRRANNDLHNFLAAADIATIFLDTELKIKRFTPAATKIVNLIESDRGRPFKHTVLNFADGQLHQDLAHVLDTLNTVEREIQTEGGQWFNMRIMPYRTLDNVIEGVVLTFTQIAAQKQVETGLRRLNEALRQARDFARNIVDTLHESVLILDDALHVISANASFYRKFEVTPQQTEGNLIYELGNRQWDIPQLRELLEEIIPQNSTIEQYDIEHNFPDIGRRTMRLNARRLNRPEGEAGQILLAIEDMTNRG